MTSLLALVREATRLAGIDVCADGHTWVFIGGRAMFEAVREVMGGGK